MNHIHINQPEFWLGRTVRRCTTCQRRRRFIVRFYVWHPSEWACGGCGHEWCNEAGRAFSTSAQRTNRRQWVKQKWNTVPSIKDATRAMLES